MKYFIYAVAMAAAFPLFADSVDERLARMEKMMESMQQQMQQKDAEIADLRRQLGGLGAEAKNQPLSGHDHDDHGHDHDAPGHDADHDRLSGLDVNLAGVLTMTAGGSSVEDEALESLQGGGHDPQKRGFSFNQLELSLTGGLEDAGTFEAHVVILEDEIELEEAFVSRMLPGDFELTGGYFLTAFGSHNELHPHDWGWIDQPVVASRLFGGDGLAGVGLELEKRTPIGALTFSVQQAGDEGMISFGGEGHHHGEEHGEEEEELPFEEGIGGRPAGDIETHGAQDLLYAVRLSNRFGLSEHLSLSAGTSYATGPNGMGSDERTDLFGLDLRLAYHPDGCADHEATIVWQTEFIARRFDAPGVTIEGGDPNDASDDFVFAEDRLDDWGVYSQLSYRIDDQWSVGLRGEYASGSGQSYEEGAAISRNEDATRDNRLRIAPLVVFQPDASTRFRLQYNYDDAEHLAEGEAHSLWLGFEWLIGSHADHQH